MQYPQSSQVVDFYKQIARSNPELFSACFALSQIPFEFIFQMIWLFQTPAKRMNVPS
jgi:hypothetical protein